jgi:predicted TPR repeat methyltransferase
MEPDELDIDLSQPLSIPDALRLATALHRAGHVDDAQVLYQRVLDLAPEHPDALHFMGMLAHDQGRREDALALISRSVELAPEHVGFRSNLGNLMLDSERFDDAEREYRQALALDPDRPDALNNYGVLCKALRRYEDAELSLLRAIDLAPDFVDARNNLANLYFQIGRPREAFEQTAEALSRRPRDARTREMLGHAYARLKRFDDAAAVYREWLAEDPDNPKAVHHLAACTGEAIPARASDAYVQTVFDVFSRSFESRLASLEYRAPALVGEAIARCLGPAAAEQEVLDAGCGTGLCGPLLKPFASRLTGVDLSGGMLQKARGRELYDALHQAELTAFMAERPGAFDVVASADTLVYFGELGEALAAAAQALRPGGWLCFTVEALGDDEMGYRLQHHGRYAHSRGYLEMVLGQAGFAAPVIDRVVLRLEGGEPVAGWLAVAQRPESSATVSLSGVGVGRSRDG